MFRFLARNRSWPAAAAAILAMCGCAEGRTEDSRDSAPMQASTPCPPQVVAAPVLPIIAPVPMPNGPLILNASKVSLPLAAPDDRTTIQRLAAISESEGRSIVLQLRCVEADRAPGALWEVYVGPPAGGEPNAESPHFVGNIALLSAGLRSELAGERFGEFVFVLDRALAASPRGAPLNVTFVAGSGIVVDGRPTPAEVAASVRIGEMNLLLEETPEPRQ